MHKNILLYAHGGSGNHGCEAIVRATHTLLNDKAKFTLLSKNPDEDTRYGIDNLANILPHTQQDISNDLSSLLYRISQRINHTREKYMCRIYRDLYHLNGYDYAFSIGGDNYCYRNVPEEMAFLNKLLQKKGMKTVLWGCSLEPELVTPNILEDLKSYHKIVARETLTRDFLVSHGADNVILAPDPAFALSRIDLPLPDGFQDKNTVGINLSPLIMNYEKKPGLTVENYKRLIQHILSSTNMSIALIPHVVWSDNDDRAAMAPLYEQYKDTGRVLMIEDCNCCELKGYIARCRFLITARTHASIAAYSQGVPTLVMGYSTKARGIALDLFGQEDGYILPVQQLESAEQLIEAFTFLMKNEEQILSLYREKLADYIAGHDNIRNIIL